jgi:hypothetical protein
LVRALVRPRARVSRRGGARRGGSPGEVSVSAATPLRRDSLRVACLAEARRRRAKGWTSRSVVWQTRGPSRLEITLKPTGSPFVFELDRYHYGSRAGSWPCASSVPHCATRAVGPRPKSVQRSGVRDRGGFAGRIRSVDQRTRTGRARTIPTRFRQNVGRRTTARGAGGRFRYDWARPAVHLLRCPPPRLRRFGDTAFAWLA